jgi:hypothetical protein
LGEMGSQMILVESLNDVTLLTFARQTSSCGWVIIAGSFNRSRVFCFLAMRTILAAGNIAAANGCPIMRRIVALLVFLLYLKLEILTVLRSQVSAVA